MPYHKSLEIREALGERPNLVRTYALLGVVAERLGDLTGALNWTVRCVSLFDEFPHPATGPGPYLLARLAASLGLPALEENWQRCTGRALPERIRAFVASSPNGRTASGGGLLARIAASVGIFGSKRTRSFADPATGTRLELELPKSWSSVANRYAPICLQNSTDGSLLQITPFPPPLSENFRQDMRKSIQGAVDQALLKSVERSIEVHDFRGKAGVGYYFSAQDRNPEPSGWAFMTDVWFEGKGYVFHCTILSHHAPPNGINEAMTALMDLRVVTAGT